MPYIKQAYWSGVGNAWTTAVFVVYALAFAKPSGFTTSDQGNGMRIHTGDRKRGAADQISRGC